MKQFGEDLKFLVLIFLEDIGELVIYPFIILRFIYEDFKEAVLETWDAIRNGGLDDE